MATRIIYEGDEAAAHSYLPVAQNLLHKVREFVAASGAGVYSSSLVLSDTAYAYALKTGDIEVIHIFALPQTSSETTTTEYKEPPLFLSGVVRNGYIRTDIVENRKVKFLESFRPNSPTRRRLKASDIYQSNKRLAVPPSEFAQFDEFGYTAPPEREISQYTVVRPSNYSGRMQALVQVVLGYGHIAKEQIIERDEKRKTEIIKNGLQLSYDCRWLRTHGLHTAPDGVQWLIEVSVISGVVAMRLPLYPKTAALANSEDPAMADIAAAAKEFGGLPTGGSFPNGQKLDAGIAAGTILRLLTVEEMAEFFALNPYFSTCGWAFNTKGTEARNTAWTIDGLLRTGKHFKLAIEIGPLKKKVDKNEPIAEASARLSLAEEGSLYYNTDPETAIEPIDVPVFKVYEPLVQSLLSFDFGTAQEMPSVRSDTTILAYFADDDLKVVRYFNNQTRNDDYFEEHFYDSFLYVGRQYQTIHSGANEVPAMFYSTDVDHRSEVRESEYHMNSIGEKYMTRGPFLNNGSSFEGSAYIDYGNPKFPFSGPADIEENPGADWCSIKYTARYEQQTVFMSTTTIESVSGRGIRSGIIVPEGLREGYVYGYIEYTGPKIHSEQIAFHAVRQTATGFAAQLQNLSLPGEPIIDRGWLIFETGQSEARNPTELLDPYGFSDEGEFCEVGEVPSTNDPPAYPDGQDKFIVETATAKLFVRLFTSLESGGIKLYEPEDRQKVLDLWKEQWEVPSPSGPVGYQQMAAFHSSRLGERLTVYDITLNPEPKDRKGIGQSVQDVATTGKRDLYNFIGVP